MSKRDNTAEVFMAAGLGFVRRGEKLDKALGFFDDAMAVFLERNDAAGARRAEGWVTTVKEQLAKTQPQSL